MSPFKVHLQPFQHLRHARIESRFVVLLERGFQVDPSIIRFNELPGVVTALCGLADVQLVGKHGVEIPVPACHEDV